MSKPFVTAQHAARELGVDVSVVVNEITNPMQACSVEQRAMETNRHE